MNGIESIHSFIIAYKHNTGRMMIRLLWSNVHPFHVDVAEALVN